MNLETQTSQPPPRDWLTNRLKAPAPTHGDAATAIPPVAAVIPPEVTRRRELPAGRPVAPPRSSGWAKISLALLVGAMAGGALLFAEPFQHRCGVVLQVPALEGSDQPALYKKELLEFMLEPDRAHATASAFPWVVDQSSPSQLRASFLTTDAERDAHLAEEWTRAFFAHVSARLDASAPTPGEGFLQAHVATLGERLSEAQKELDAAMGQLPASDPRIDRDSLLSRWQIARQGFAAAREQLNTTSEELRRLQARHPADLAAVETGVREAALLADFDLQEDLKELSVTLSELKLHLLNVWQRSAPALSQLTASAGVWFEQLTRRGSDDVSPAVGPVLDALIQDLRAYRSGLDTFAKGWNAEFTTLKQGDFDPRKSDLLDAYQRTKTLLSDYLFHSGSRLTALRTSVNQLARNPEDDARLHVLHSEVARGFAELQSAHHRFEFTAGAIETPDNFRLDSTLRIARGLLRRVSDRIRVIDDRLQAEAARQAEAQRARMLEALDEVLRQSRMAGDSAVDELLALHDRIQNASARGEEFAAAVVRAELANARLQDARHDFDMAGARLQTMASQRAKSEIAPGLAQISCGVLAKYENLPERLRVAGIAAAVTFLTVLLGQILLSRALWPTR